MALAFILHLERGTDAPVSFGIWSARLERWRVMGIFVVCRYPQLATDGPSLRLCVLIEQVSDSCTLLCILDPTLITGLATLSRRGSGLCVAGNSDLATACCGSNGIRGGRVGPRLSKLVVGLDHRSFDHRESRTRGSLELPRGRCCAMAL